MDAYYQASEHEEVVVEPAPEYLERLAGAGKDTNVLWRLRRQLPGRRSAGQTWVEHLAGILVDTRNSSRQVSLELHMDDIHGGCCDHQF